MVGEAGAFTRISPIFANGGGDFFTTDEHGFWDPGWDVCPRKGAKQVKDRLERIFTEGREGNEESKETIEPQGHGGTEMAEGAQVNR
jgi:hypothetical protein